MADVSIGADPVGGDTAHDGVDSGRPVKIGGKANSAIPTAVAASDRVDAWYDLNGAAVVNTVMGKTLKTVSIDRSTTGTVISSVASKRLKVYAVKLVVDAAISVSWRDGGSTALEGAQALPANGGYVEVVNPPAFLFATSAGNALDLVISGTGNARGRVSYWDDDAS